MSNSLRGKKISESFSKLVQVIDGIFYDGLGNSLSTLNGATAGIGPQGTQGLRGAIGFSGVGGTQGFQGFQGPQGWQGYDGTQGYQGSMGFQGVQGFEGAQGVQGYDGMQGFQGWQGFQGIQGIQGAQGYQGPQGIEASRDFLSVVLSGGATTSASVLSLYDKPGAYDRNLTHNSSTIFLNPSNETGKTYQIQTSFSIYNASIESHTFSFKVDGTNWGLEISLGQHGVDDFTYNVNTFSDIIVLDSSASLQFWRTSNNTTNPAVQGYINIIEI
jgi:hypothetical protein